MTILLCVLSLAMLGSAGQQAPAAATGAEAAIRTADAAWMKAIAAKSVEDTVAVYDPEAVTAGSAMFPAQGLRAFRDSWKMMFARPGFDLSWETTKVVVTQSETIGYSTATWKNGADHGPAIAVWRKQSDGSWKVLIDAAWGIPPSR